MQEKLTKIFKNTKYEPGLDLNEKIWSTIAVRNKRNAQNKFWIFAFMGFSSTIGLIPVVKILLTDLSQSGFYEYSSLLFSDSAIIVSYWKELILILAESLPIMSIILTLSLVFVLFLSFRYAMKQINNNHIGETYGIA
jgi:hypothetical protein